MYKVVRKLRGRLYSATISKRLMLLSTLKKWLVKYEPNKWAKAKIGKLFVFKNLDDAINFVKETRFMFSEEVEIWRCKTIDTQQMNLMETSIYRYLLFWATDPPPSPIHNIPTPKGTFVASKVMLTKRVRDWNISDCSS